MEGAMLLVMIVVGAACLFAQLRLFRISSALEELMTEVKLLRTQHLLQLERITEAEFEQRARRIVGDGS